MIRFDGRRETIIPEPEPDADVMLFSYLPGLSRATTRVIADSPLTRLEPQTVPEKDRAYYQRRAEAEIELAQKAQHEAAVRSHYLLAGYYLDLANCDRLIDQG
jgi:hypothetical protein